MNISGVAHFGFNYIQVICGKGICDSNILVTGELIANDYVLLSSRIA